MNQNTSDFNAFKRYDITGHSNIKKGNFMIDNLYSSMIQIEKVKEVEVRMEGNED